MSKKLIACYVLALPITGAKDVMGNPMGDVKLHSIIAVDKGHAEIGKKLYTGKKGVFYPDDLAEKIATYTPPKPATKPKTTTNPADEPEKKKKKKSKKDK